MSKRALLLLSLCLFAIAVKSQGQALDRGRAQSGDAAVPVNLGQSVVSLYGPWKFHVGDDPRWSDPNFDDSQWETVDLTHTANHFQACRFPALLLDGKGEGIPATRAMPGIAFGCVSPERRTR